VQDYTSPEWAAVRHVLTTPLIAERTAPYLGADVIAWDGLLAETETMSGGEKLLVGIAHDLCHAGRGVSLTDLTRRLDGRNFERVMEALRLCRTLPFVERESLAA
jgi:hypothetical protein